MYVIIYWCKISIAKHCKFCYQLNQQTSLLWITWTFITSEGNVFFELLFEIVAKEKPSDFYSLITCYGWIKWPRFGIVMSKSIVETFRINRIIKPVTEKEKEISELRNHRVLVKMLVSLMTLFWDATKLRKY